MAIVNVFSLISSLSDKTFFNVHLNAKETAQVGDEVLYGPCWAVVTSHTEPARDKAGNLIWRKGEVRLSAQNPVRKVGKISRAWMNHFHPQNGFRKSGEYTPVYWDLPEYTGVQSRETLSLFREWRISCSGGYTPEVPKGWVAVSPTTMSSSSWLLMREDDPRIEAVKVF